MKVVHIKKAGSSFHKEHFLILFEQDLSYNDHDVESFVDDWVRKDPSGQNNGYSYSWEIVSDTDVIISVLEKEIKEIDKRTERLKKDSDAIEKQIKFILDKTLKS